MFENFTSVFENYKGKIRNPFIGTIISVWIIRNWIIIYSLFNFDKECTLQQKINYINDYFAKIFFWKETFSVVFIALVVLFLTFIFMGVSRLITDAYYKIAEPFVINLLDKKTIFTHEDKVKMEKKIETLNKSLDYNREEITRAETVLSYANTNRDSIQKKYDDLLLSSSESIKKLIEQYETFKIKAVPANKVISYYDAINSNFNEDDKRELKKLFKDRNLINSGNYSSMHFQDKMLEKGFLSRNEENHLKLNINGILFVEYVKILAENDLPH